MILKLLDFKKKRMHKPVHKEDMIEFLKWLIEEVRADHVRGLMAAYTFMDDETASGGCRFGEQDLMLVGRIELLKQHMVRDLN